MRMGKLAEAETNATKALEIYPKSSEIKKTFEHIRQKSGKL